jgi:hypothetical protein
MDVSTTNKNEKEVFMSVELYPELIDYIFGYCGKFYTEKENKAAWHQFAMDKSKNGTVIAFVNHFTERGLLSTDKEVLTLLDKGFQNYKLNVAERIWAQHKDELELNLCPGCGKIARTPFAKQCRFCYHDWH